MALDRKAYYAVCNEYVRTAEREYLTELAGLRLHYGAAIPEDEMANLTKLRVQAEACAAFAQMERNLDDHAFECVIHTGDPYIADHVPA